METTPMNRHEGEREIPCPDCHGAGSFPTYSSAAGPSTGREDCRTCRGDGTIWVEVDGEGET